MKKNLTFIALLWLFSSIWVWFFSYNQEFNTNVSDFYAKNLSWDSGIQETLHYTIGNTIEYTYILEGTPGTAKISLESVNQELENLEAEISGKKYPIENDSIFVELEDISALKLTGITKNNQNNAQKPEITVEILAPEEDTDAPSQEIQEIKEILEYNVADFTISEYEFQSNFDNLLEISGKHVENIDFINIGWVSFEPIFVPNDTSRLFINIPKNIFWNGDFFILLQMNNGELLTLEKQIRFSFVDTPINIVNITPKTLSNEQAQFIVIQWNGFEKIISLQLSNNIVIQNTNFSIINDKVMSIEIPKGLDPWEYFINIMDINGITEIPYHFISITS